jgi:hypothetical protein
MSDASRASRKQAWGWTTGLAMALLLLYALSWGPVKVHYRIPHDVGRIELFLDDTPGWLKRFYSPIDELREIEWIEKASDAYFAWCDRMMH